jgi:ribonuclease-3
MPEISKLERQIGYEFRDKTLLETALTHSSYTGEHQLGYDKNNERLEFIGDAYVDAVVGTRLFEIMKESHEGALSKFRADVVCETSLAEAAKEINLGDYLRLGKGEAAGGGSSKASILSDAFEALIGAIYIDGGYESCSKVILSLLETKIQMAAEGRLSRDYKTRLQEKVQVKDKNAAIEYRTVKEEGPDHNKTFTVELTINGNKCGTGTGSSKARAEQAAASDALSKGV